MDLLRARRGRAAARRASGSRSAPGRRPRWRRSARRPSWSATSTRSSRRTCAVLGQQLGADLANVLERSPDGERFVLRAGWNWPRGLGRDAHRARRPALAGRLRRRDGRAGRGRRPRARRSASTPPPLMLAAGIASSLTVPIGPEDDVFGVLSVHSQRQRAFSADDASFAQGVANVLAAAVRRARDDEALREGEASLQLVLAGTRTAAWWWEVGENRIRWSEGVAALHGLPEDGAPVEYEQLIGADPPRRPGRAGRRRAAERRGGRRLRARVPHRAPRRRRALAGDGGPRRARRRRRARCG